MRKGVIPINQDFELEYRYYEKDPRYKYFNRKFEIYLVKKESFKRRYVLHMDNCDTTKWAPHIHKASNVSKKLYFGVTTLNWSDIKNNFLECVVAEIGERNREEVKRAIARLLSPKL